MGKLVGKDAINPDHYKKQCSIECIEAMEIAFGAEGVVNFCLCNAFKYLWRHTNKAGYEDLEKASWYVDAAREKMPLMGDKRGLYEAKLLSLSEVIATYVLYFGGKS